MIKLVSEYREKGLVQARSGADVSVYVAEGETRDMRLGPNGEQVQMAGPTARELEELDALVADGCRIRRAAPLVYVVTYPAGAA